jgi:hypothetical protein
MVIITTDHGGVHVTHITEAIIIIGTLITTDTITTMESMQI